MSKIALFVLAAIVVLLIGASVVFAQDATTTTPGAALASPICPIAANGVGSEQMRQAMGTGDLEQMRQLHDSMTPVMQGTGTEQMHEAMGQALENGDVQQMQGTCQTYMNSQDSGSA